MDILCKFHFFFWSILFFPRNPMESTLFCNNNYLLAHSLYCTLHIYLFTGLHNDLFFLCIFLCIVNIHYCTLYNIYVSLRLDICSCRIHRKELHKHNLKFPYWCHCYKYDTILNTLFSDCLHKLFCRLFYS